MWIQVRTIDGSQTRTIEDVSRKATIEELRERVWALFDVRPECQRLFYRGKQLENGYTLFDYDVGLNDIIQLLVRPDPDLPSTSKQIDVQAKPCSNSPPKVKKTPRVGPSSQPSTSTCDFLIDPGIGLYKVNELVDARDVGLGAWFEARIRSVTRASDGHSRGKTPLKNGSSCKRTNGNVNHNSKENTNKLDSVPSTSNSDSVAADEDVIYHIEYDEYPESGTVEINVKDLRPRARTNLKWNELNVGDVVMVNYSVENPGNRGFWFDAEITALKTISRTKKELRVNIILGGSEGKLNDCQIRFVNEIFKIEKPGAHPLSLADGKFLRKNDPECDICGGDPNKKCRSCSCHICGGKQEPNMQLLCDECNMAYHIYCLNPPLDKVPEEEYWYDYQDGTNNPKIYMEPEKTSNSQRNIEKENQSLWHHNSRLQALLQSYHVQDSMVLAQKQTPRSMEQNREPRSRPSTLCEAGVHRPHVGGIHGRSNDGAYSLVLAGGFADEVDRGDEFTYTGSGGKNLAGNKRIGAPSADQTLTNMNRALALNCDAPLDDKIGAESRNWRAGKPVRVIRSFKGRKISKYAPEEGNRYDGIYKVVKYWPEISSSHGFLVWRYLLRRDDVEPAPWTSEGIERSRRLCLRLQYPVGYPSDKEGKKTKGQSKKQASGSSKRPTTDDDCPSASKVLKTPDSAAEAVEAFQLTPQQQHLIREDHQNQKLWNEVLASLAEGPNFLKKLEQSFMCVCCQELVYQPVTTDCLHNVCKDCLQRSFKAQVFSCPACRHDLGQNYLMIPNEILQTLLELFFPGYSKGR
uniref:E3 ubiquitin-protein ligase UHRF n=1 Tax=Neovison vison TaxID=452646 RepID=A0A8C7EXI3_NEOVI